MRFLCLGYYDPERFDALSDAGRKGLGERCRPHDEAFNATGAVVSAATLGHGSWAHIRPTESGPSVTDGPFTEAKEIVGSYFIIEAGDLEEAVRIASLHPGSPDRPGGRVLHGGAPHRACLGAGWRVRR